ncbi:MAG: amidase [Gemmataceae bacterium]
MVGGASVALLGPLKAGSLGQSQNVVSVEEKDLSTLAEELASGKVTSRQLVQAYLDRIEAIDRKGPALNSVIEINPDALSIADQLDTERKKKGPRGPLHGLPILIKDNIDTADKMATTAGSLALVGSRPSRDAWLVERLRKAGALILGKTNLSEWANARGNRSTSGWSGRGGLTKNPHVLDRNPSGSSSGSAVAVAASLCAGAVGTETDGSILSPAAHNGVVGLKPTVGMVSRSGIIPIAHSQDTAGPMARTVRDAALLLGGMAGIDPAEKAELIAQRPPELQFDFTARMKPGVLKGVRLGVAKPYLNFHDQVDPILAKSFQVLREQGAVLVEINDLPKGRTWSSAEVTVLHYEMKAGLEAYLASLGPGAPVKTVEDILAFNRKNADRELQHFGQEFLETVASKGGLDSVEYKKALAQCRRVARENGIDRAMDKLALDAIVGPCSGPAGLTNLASGDSSSGGYDMISLAAVAGYPSISVPAGNDKGLPVAIMFVGKPWSEVNLLGIAYGFEQATKARRAPRYLNTVPVG